MRSLSCERVIYVQCLPLQAWVDEMANYMKGLDPNHLLTLGEEGFYSLFKDGIPANPGGAGGLISNCSHTF